jgi:hypothetical protein
MPRVVPPRIALLKVALRDEMKRGHVHEADLRDPKFHLDGLCDGNKVYVNPAPGVVEALLHELCHRRFPRWSEKRVLAESRRLLCHLSERELRGWYREYQQVAVKRKRPVKVDE